VSSSTKYVLKDFVGSSHRILAGWVRDLPRGSRLLELGPGVGHVARLAQRRDLHWLGLESSIDCTWDLRKTLSGGAIVDLESLPSLPRWDGAILAADTLEHLGDPVRMLRLIHDALPPGGLLMLSVPNVANAYVRLNLLIGRFPYADRGILDRTHRFFFTARSLRDMVTSSGFVIERSAVSTIPLPLLWPRLSALILAALSMVLATATRYLPRLLGYQLLLRARRAAS
jgi:SAM-dependent methyltransferase